MYQRLRDIYARRHEQWHERRADLFVELMRPSAGTRVLDLGGNDGSFLKRIRARVPITGIVADINASALERARASGLETIAISETGTLPFADKAYDIVFCNSVIEHVTLPKHECIANECDDAEWNRRSRANQHAFADEIRRIGVAYFVQTPHRAFPIEAHTWLPGVGWLPHRAATRVIRFTDRFWVRKPGYVDWELLDSSGMRAMFPDSQIHVERTFGLPKSLIAYRRSVD